ncbi:MAG: PaaI family thioesterase [Deltaproteobacteria bacterium]|nr:PaaI family thioesterase [Deltaproteobacteria bacterium]
MVQIADLKSGAYWAHMGMDLAVGEQGETLISMEISSNIKQFYGYAHGGAIAGLLDSAIAVAINQQLDPGEGAYTAELKIHYLRLVSDGQLWGEGKVIQKGKNLIVGQGEIKDNAGQLVAFGTATFILTKVEECGESLR